MIARWATAWGCRLTIPAAIGMMLLSASGCAVTHGASASGGRQGTVCTPVVGRRTGDRGFFYPFTPLAGVYTGGRKGAWFFPLFSCQEDAETGRRHGLFLLWGHYWRHKGRGVASLFPLFHHVSDGPVDSAAMGRYGTDLRCLIVSRYRHQSFVDPMGRRSRVKECSVWPLYRYVHRFAPDTGATVRKRLSIAWRLFRYERAPNGTKIHVLFLPVYQRGSTGDASR